MPNRRGKNVLTRVFQFQRPRPQVMWVAAVVLAAVIVWALLVPGTDWLAHHDVGSAKGSLATARDAARGRLLFLGVGLFTAGTLIYTGRSFRLSQRTFELTEQGQVTDRYTKAIDQLGSERLDVRIGGIYALERIARDSVKDHPAVMEVLTAFIRDHSPEPWPVDSHGAQVGEKTTRPDIQAAVTVVGRRDVRQDRRVIDLSRANLTGALLTYAKFGGATISVTPGMLFEWDTSWADEVTLELDGANLHGANLRGARLQEADLRKAHLDGADLTGADLTGVFLDGADLTGAHFDGAELGAVRWPDGAPVPDSWMIDNYRGRRRLYRTGARWPDWALPPDGWTFDSGSGRLKPAGQLSEVTAHYL